MEKLKADHDKLEKEIKYVIAVNNVVVIVVKLLLLLFVILLMPHPVTWIIGRCC